MPKQTRKPLKWIESVKRDLDAMPETPRPYRDLTLEVMVDFRSDTDRAVYSVKFAG